MDGYDSDEMWERLLSKKRDRKIKLRKSAVVARRKKHMLGKIQLPDLELIQEKLLASKPKRNLSIPIKRKACKMPMRGVSCYRCKMIKVRKLIKKRQDEQRVELDYTNFRRQCQSFDLATGMIRPFLRWFWPPREYNILISIEEIYMDILSENVPTEQEILFRVNTIAEYLRDNYKYCPWCKLKFRDLEDLRLYCPGPTRKDHMLEMLSSSSSD